MSVYKRLRFLINAIALVSIITNLAIAGVVGLALATDTDVVLPGFNWNQNLPIILSFVSTIVLAYLTYQAKLIHTAVNSTATALVVKADAKDEEIKRLTAELAAERSKTVQLITKVPNV